MIRSSYIQNGNSYTGKTVTLCCIFTCYQLFAIELHEGLELIFVALFTIAWIQMRVYEEVKLHMWTVQKENFLCVVRSIESIAETCMSRSAYSFQYRTSLFLLMPL